MHFITLSDGGLKTFSLCSNECSLHWKDFGGKTERPNARLMRKFYPIFIEPSTLILHFAHFHRSCEVFRNPLMSESKHIPGISRGKMDRAKQRTFLNRWDSAYRRWIQTVIFCLMGGGSSIFLATLFKERFQRQNLRKTEMWLWKSEKFGYERESRRVIECTRSL